MQVNSLLVLDDSEIFETKLDLENQRVVKVDAERTRVQDKLNKEHIELILTLYCQKNKLKYK